MNLSAISAIRRFRPLQEFGGMLPAGPVLALTLLTVAAWSINTSFLTSEKTKIENAVYAATVDGGHLVMFRTRTKLEEMLRNQVVQNLAIQNVRVDPSNVSVSVNTANHLVQVALEHESDLAFELPFLPDSVKLPASLAASTSDAAIQVALDRTISMNSLSQCPGPDPATAPFVHPCDPIQYVSPSVPTPVSVPPDGQCVNICLMKIAAHRFLDAMPVGTHVGMFAFARFYPISPMHFQLRIDDQLTEIDREDAHEDIDYLHPQGGTAFTTFAKTAEDEFATYPGNAKKFLVVFTDGENKYELTNDYPLDCFQNDGLDYIGKKSIQATDRLRADNVTIYVVALGDPSQEEEALLHRLANSPKIPSTLDFTPMIQAPPDCGSSTAGDCACVPRVGQNYPQGKVFITSDGAELPTLFELVLSEIRKVTLQPANGV